MGTIINNTLSTIHHTKQQQQQQITIKVPIIYHLSKKNNNNQTNNKIYYNYCNKCLKYKLSNQFYIYAGDDIICEECKILFLYKKKMKYFLLFNDDYNRD